MASVNIQDNVTLSDEVSASHEIGTFRFFPRSVFHRRVIGGCSGLAARFRGSLLVATSPAAKHSGAPEHWRGWRQAET